MPGITRTEAIERARVIAVDGYEVSLDLTDPGPGFGSTTTARFRCLDPGADTFLDVRAETVESAVLNGHRLDLTDLRDGRLRLRGLHADNELVIVARMAYSHDGEGLHRHLDPADGRNYLYAMSFLDAAPRWFACFDQPDLKAPIRLHVTCPPDWTVAGNGAAAQVGPGRWDLAPTRPIATYAMTLIAGPYHSVDAEHDGTRLVLHCRASLAEHLDRDARELFTVTARCLDEYHRLFGVRYPWGEYHQAFVPEFNAGAMENPGCVTFRDTLLFRSRATDGERGARAATIAHEMAHMWFGDLVTMRWWDDLWLNESFADYLGHRVCDAVTAFESWVEFGIVGKAWGYRADRRPSTHPIAGNGADDAGSALADFDGISYAKGASALRQLARYLGDDVFLAGLRDYFARFAYGNAELGDLLDCWRDAGATGLSDWARAWLRAAGTDTLRVVADTVVREPPADSTARRPHVVDIGGYHASGRRDSVLPIVIAAERTTIPTWFAGFVLPDDNDETWAKIAFDETLWPTLGAALPELAAPARVTVWNALRSAVADTELSPITAVEIVAHAIVPEPNDIVIASVLDWAGLIAGTHLTDDDRSRGYALLAGAADRVLADAAPASGRQLAGARAFAALTLDIDTLRRWLAGVGLPAGLVVDTELRWSILERLAALGSLEAGEIDAEAARDGTSQGAIHAVSCRVLRPDQDSKQQAWRSLFHDPARGNYELYAIARGFWHPLHEDITAVFLERFFTDIVGLGALRSGWLLARLAEFAYPWTAVSPTTIQLTEQLLARPGLDPGVRRAVLDAGDDLRRALAARRRFA